MTPSSPTPLLILGVCHFAASSDSYQQQVRFDALAPARQREMEELARRLAEFRPTRIAVESLPERQSRLDSLYGAYLEGSYALGANEIYQLGFRLARNLGHQRVHAVDARMRGYTSYDDLKKSLSAFGQDSLLDFGKDPWGAKYRELFRHDDSAKAARPLLEHLAYLNSERRLLASMGTNLVGLFKAGSDTLPLGPDWITQSFNRDLRIFQNLQRLAQQPGERILLIIGASHVPMLRLLAQSSPEFEVVEVHQYLRTPR